MTAPLRVIEHEGPKDGMRHSLVVENLSYPGNSSLEGFIKSRLMPIVPDTATYTLLLPSR